MENRYGTTSDMIVRELEHNGSIRLIAIDDKGLYITSRDRVDRSVADVNRYGVPRETMIRKLEKLGLDPLALFNSNRHLIKTEGSGGKGKALNPIKASKRRM